MPLFSEGPPFPPDGPLTCENVEKQLARDFPREDQDELLRLLDSIRLPSTASNARDRVRVQRDVLRLSQGNVEKLRHNVEAAKHDYRDVIYWAEYPPTLDELASHYPFLLDLIEYCRAAGGSLNEAGHRAALEQLRRARAKLDPVDDIRAYAGLSHGMAIHAIAAAILRRHSIELDNHQGMVRWLERQGYAQIADAFGRVESIRTGRWYGRQGNGSTAHELDGFLAQIEAWSVA